MGVYEDVSKSIALSKFLVNAHPSDGVKKWQLTNDLLPPGSIMWKWQLRTGKGDWKRKIKTNAGDLTGFSRIP